jgi:hypothetical protein
MSFAMNRRNSTLLTLAVLLLLLLSLASAAAPFAHAQASLSFSGGNGTPLVLTLNAPLVYTINTTPTGSGPFFVFKNVGNALGSQQGASGTISYAINAGTLKAITAENSGQSVGSIGASDLFIFGTASTLTLGDTVTLTAGTLTTNSNVLGPPPAGGNFATFISDANGVQISTAGATVPEPTTWALLTGGLLTLVGIQRVRRRHQAPA